MSVIDGRKIAEILRLQVAMAVESLRASDQLRPGLAVVRVGDDPASEVYVRNKVKQTQAAGMRSFDFHMPAKITQEALLEKVQALNSDPAVHGILVQLPLPGHISEQAVIECIDPIKDVDGFHAMNSGRLMNGDAHARVPCTPMGCVILAKQVLGKDLSGKHAVVIGRSNIVGKPVAMLLLQENCTVTVTHSRTEDLVRICRQADILVAALGRAHTVGRDWVKPGAVVIDVGINRVDTSGGATRLVGDVDFDAVSDIAGSVTPVPGGVGPMTIACLLKNTVVAACDQNALPLPDAIVEVAGL
ncbi:MAG: bifunctional methylenetetrahydrofolate dehydrogenase/methenyltetrahydrofolate cyclohydrolase FolD [Pseudomonadota bacterium]